MIAPGQAERDVAASAARHAALELEEIYRRLAADARMMMGPAAAMLDRSMRLIKEAREELHLAADLLYREEETK